MPVNLAALVGGNQGQGGVAPYLNDYAKQNQQRQQLAQLYQAVQQARGGDNSTPGLPQAAPGAAPAPSALPGGTATPPPSAAGVPAGAPVPTPGSAGPQISSMPPASPQNPGAGVPSMDKIMAAVANMPNLRDDQKMQILEQYGAFASPYEKMLQQMEMKTQQYQFQSQRAEDMMNNARTIAAMREGGANTRAAGNQEQKAGAQDIGALEKQVSDQRSVVTSILNTPGGINTPEYKAEKANYDAMMQELTAARKGGGAKKEAPGQNPASGGAPAGAVPVPPEGAKLPDGTQVPDSDGKMWIKQGNYLVPAG